MLKTLQRLGIVAAPAASAAEQEKEQVNMSDVNAEALASLQASFDAVTEQLTAAKAQIEELTALVNQASEFKLATEKAAKEAALAARKEKAVNAVGAEKAEKLMTATANMDDASFAAVLSVASTSLKEEAETPLFKDVGVDGATDASAVETNETMKILMDKYHKTTTTK